MKAPKGPGRYRLAEFFSEDPPQGPHKFATDKKGLQISAFAAPIIARKQAREQAAKMHMYEEDVNFVGEATAQKKREALAKASAKAAAGAKRRMILTLAEEEQAESTT